MVLGFYVAIARGSFQEESDAGHKAGGVYAEANLR